MRRKAAVRLAEAVARLLAQAALDRGQAETALRLLRECRPNVETLELRAATLTRLGRAGEAEAARKQAESLRD